MKNYNRKEIDNDGNIRYYLNDKYHRIDGPAIEWADGDKEWYINGQCHRIDGPAIEFANGDKYWYINGRRHRIDGPAIEYANGSKFWYINDECYTKQEFNKKLKSLKCPDYFNEKL